MYSVRCVCCSVFGVCVHAAEGAGVTGQRAWECWSRGVERGVLWRGREEQCRLSGRQCWVHGRVVPSLTFANKGEGCSALLRWRLCAAAAQGGFLSNFLCKLLFLAVVSSFLWHKALSGSCSRHRGVRAVLALCFLGGLIQPVHLGEDAFPRYKALARQIC